MPDQSSPAAALAEIARLVGVDPGWLETNAARVYLADLAEAAALLGPDVAEVPVVPDFDPAWPDPEEAR